MNVIIEDILKIKTRIYLKIEISDINVIIEIIVIFEHLFWILNKDSMKN